MHFDTLGLLGDPLSLSLDVSRPAYKPNPSVYTAVGRGGGQRSGSRRVIPGDVATAKKRIHALGAGACFMGDHAAVLSLVLARICQRLP
jgi:hypothetical protein